MARSVARPLREVRNRSCRCSWTAGRTSGSCEPLYGTVVSMDYQELDRLISELEEKVEDAERGGCTWKEVWSDVGHIGAQFKGTWYPTRDDKDAAWARFQEMVQRIKARREEHRERSEQRRRESEDKREDWTRKAEVSARHKEEIVSHARSGRPPSGLEEMLAGVVPFPLEAIVRTVTLGHGSILPGDRKSVV